jgi:uncharacterized membrane-anchored protein
VAYVLTRSLAASTGGLLAQPKSAGCGFVQSLIFSVIIVVTVGALTVTKHNELPTVKDETAKAKGPDNAVYPQEQL